MAIFIRRGTQKRAWGTLLMLLCVSTTGALAQTGGGHMLFGDVKVDESLVPGLKPQSYVVILYSVMGGPGIMRQSVSNGGRYRFLGVRNGEFNIAVEVDGEEIGRVHFLLMELYRTDIRKDLHLEWRPDRMKAAAGINVTGTVSYFYNRAQSAELLFQKALSANAAKKYPDALALLNRIVTSDAKDYEAWAELGTIRFIQNEFSEAERCYTRALEQQPAYLPALINLGKLFMAQKNHDRAQEVLLQAVQRQPKSAKAQHVLGEAYLQGKKGSKAVIHFTEALRLDPAGQAEAHLRLAALYDAAGMKEKAATEYAAFLEKRPDFPQKKRLQHYIKTVQGPRS